MYIQVHRHSIIVGEKKKQAMNLKTGERYKGHFGERKGNGVMLQLKYNLKN